MRGVHTGCLLQDVQALPHEEVFTMQNIFLFFIKMVMLNSCEVSQRLLFELSYPTDGSFLEQET